MKQLNEYFSVTSSLASILALAFLSVSVVLVIFNHLFVVLFASKHQRPADLKKSRPRSITTCVNTFTALKVLCTTQIHNAILKIRKEASKFQPPKMP